MSDTTIIVISILIFLLILFAGTAWLVFVYFPKKTLSVANELAETVKNTLGLTPQVTINQKIIYKRTNEILQLAMIEQDYDVEYETSDKLLGSEKRINLRGMYRAKIGFDLQKGFNIEVHRGGFLKPGQVILQLPRAEILSVEPLDVQKESSSGLINWVTNKDIDNAMKELSALAQDKASKLEMLDDAEKRIENRLNEALLPRLVNYQLTHQVKFLELGTGERN
ncbi:MAG TPA: DUF4230 domain-containing protein [Anaerolineales bacterium]|jgi:hypothetical protein|nr:DUF4230 domain-containing protein [Anaerolineales bacterium]HQX15722.1 DUF4230 domain-containing protein [Anaerolineales bacterium]